MTDEPAVRTRRRRPLLLAGVAVGALALLGWALGQRADPRDLVVAYADAVAAGDVEAANALATDGADGEGPLPDPGSMDDAELVTDVRVSREGEPTGVGTLSGERYDALGYDALRYDVSFRVQGREVSVPVHVQQTGGWWLWADWRVRGSLAQPARILLTYPLRGLDVGVGSSTVPLEGNRAAPRSC